MSRIPVTLQVLMLVVSLTSFYTFVGQMVPQVEVHPPQATEIKTDISAEEMVALGQEIFAGKGTCTLCHTIGKTGGQLRFPDLAGIGERAGQRIAGLDDVGYLTQSLYEPNVFIVEGFSAGMPAVNKPPISLSDDEIRVVMAYLQSLGGEPTVTMATQLPGSDTGPTSAPAVIETAPAAETVQASLATGSPSSSDSAAIENGKRLYQQTCFICHGDQAQGNEVLNAPKLAGQESWYIARQLKNFAEGRRGADPSDIFGSQMRPMAMTLKGDQEMADLAAYLSSL